MNEPHRTTRRIDGHAAERRPGVGSAASTRASACCCWPVLLYLVWRIVDAALAAAAVGRAARLAAGAGRTRRLAARLGGRARLASAITTCSAWSCCSCCPSPRSPARSPRRRRNCCDELDAGAACGDASTLDLAHVPVLQQPLDWLGEARGHLARRRSQDWVVAARASACCSSLASSGGAVVLGALGTLVSFLLMLFVLFFVLRDGPALAQQGRAHAADRGALRGKLWQHLIDVTRAVFMGIGSRRWCRASCSASASAIAGLPSPLVFGVLGGAVRAGARSSAPRSSGCPARCASPSQGDSGMRSSWPLWGVLVVGSVDNFLRPMLISGRVEVPTLAVFVGVMGGLSAFGFIGLFLGPIVLGLLVALFRFQSDAADAASGSRLSRPSTQPGVELVATTATHRHPSQQARPVAGRARRRPAPRRASRARRSNWCR